MTKIAGGQISRPRPLPSVVGPTENALRALLSSTLSSTPVSSYPAWVILNAASSMDPAERSGWLERAADALKVDVAAAHQVVTGLRAEGLMGDDAALTVHGAAELAASRSAVEAVTARLTAGITEVDQKTARAVLDHLRERAEEMVRRAADRSTMDGREDVAD